MSIKEALDRLRLIAFATNSDIDKKIYYGALSKAYQNGDLVPATFQPDGERREAIARIIDPEAFENWERAEGNWRKDKARTACWPALEKAGVILASGLVQDEAGIREARRWPLGCHDPNSCSVSGRCMYIGCEYASADIEADVNAAIRSARDGGAET